MNGTSNARLGEQIDDVSNLAPELSQHHRHWARPGNGFVESYLKGNTRLVVRVAGDGAQWGAVFNHSPKHARIGSLGWARGSEDSDAPELRCDGEKTAVFSDSIKLMERPEEFIPSLVRLELFDSCLIGNRQPLYFFDSSIFHPVVRSGGIDDRKIDIFWPYAAVSFGEGNCQEIEAATEHMDDRARLRVDYARKLTLKPKLEEIIAGLTVWLSDDHIWFTLAPLIDAARQNTDLGFGPLDGSHGV